MRISDSIVGMVIEPIWDIYENSARLKTSRRLQKTQWYSERTLLDIQTKKLRELVKHAATTSTYYKQMFIDLGLNYNSIQNISDLQSIPVLTKKQLRANLERILSSEFSVDRLSSGKTGGSTGEALKYYCDERCVQLRNGAAIWTDGWSGWKLGQPIAAIWGNPLDPVTIKNKIRRAIKDRFIFLDTMKIDEVSIAKFVEDWKKAKPGLIYGHAHSIFLLAEMLRTTGEKLRPNGIVSTSMMLIEKERKVIEEVFSVPVTNRYGCEEVSLIGSECEDKQGFHLNITQKVVEVLDEYGNPCKLGVDGRIVVTDLTNFGMPIIRYEVGDRGILAEEACSCGRGLPLLKSLTGRTADFLVAQDGSKVAGISLIENTLTRFNGISQLQIVQNHLLNITLFLVPNPDYDDFVESQLIESLKEMLGREFTIDVFLVDGIPRENSGKYRFSICNL